MVSQVTNLSHSAPNFLKKQIPSWSFLMSVHCRNVAAVFSNYWQVTELYVFAHVEWSPCEKGQGIPTFYSTSNRNVCRMQLPFTNAARYPSRQCCLCCNTRKRSELFTDRLGTILTVYNRFQSSVFWFILNICGTAQLRETKSTNTYNYLNNFWIKTCLQYYCLVLSLFWLGKHPRIRYIAVFASLSSSKAASFSTVCPALSSMKDVTTQNAVKYITTLKFGLKCLESPFSIIRHW